jgi:hypothetical protein
MRALACALLMACAPGCGDALVDGASLNEAVFAIEGTVQPGLPEESLRVGIVWVDPAQAGAANVSSGGELLVDRIYADGTFALEFLAQPPSGAIRRLLADEDGPAYAIAWGELVLYEDRDGDRTFRVGALADGSPIAEPDVYRGMANSHLVVYVDEPLAVGHELIWGLHQVVTHRGYHLGRISCDSRPLVRRIDPPVEAMLNVVEATSVFPDLRGCLRSHP